MLASAANANTANKAAVATIRGTKFTIMALPLLVAFSPALFPFSRFATSPVHKNRLAANRPISTDPDVTAVTIMLTKLRAAVRRTIERRHAAGAACFAGAPLGLDRFLAAMMNPLGVRLRGSPDPRLPCRV
jgi:hypothetical protein